MAAYYTALILSTNCDFKRGVVLCIQIDVVGGDDVAAFDHDIEAAGANGNADTAADADTTIGALLVGGALRGEELDVVVGAERDVAPGVERAATAFGEADVLGVFMLSTLPSALLRSVRVVGRFKKSHIARCDTFDVRCEGAIRFAAGEGDVATGADLDTGFACERAAVNPQTPSRHILCRLALQFLGH